MTLTYFTGSPCNKGHYAERYTSNGVCLECKKMKYKPTGKKPGGSNLPERLAAVANNEKFYFTGKACKHGHISKRFTKTTICLECSKTVFKEKRKSRERGYSINKYGITEKQYNEMIWLQSNLCKICEQPETATTGTNNKVRPLAIDHCHKTGKIRALLCARCNSAIGLLKHNPELLRKAALYCE